MPPLARQAAPSRGGTELLLKTSRERSLCLGLDPFGSESIPGAMFLKGGEVHVSCDVLATEVIEDLLPRGVFAPGGRSRSPYTGRAAIRQIGGWSGESIPFDGDALLAELGRWKTRRRQARASPVAKVRRRNGSGRARGCGFNRHVTAGDFAVARLTRPRSHPPGTTSCSRAIGCAAAKSPPKELLDLFGGDGGIDEMLARVTAMFGTAISMMKRRKEGGLLSRWIRTPAARLRDGVVVHLVVEVMLKDPGKAGGGCRVDQREIDSEASGCGPSDG